jgi:hypothetical protein
MQAKQKQEVKSAAFTRQQSLILLKNVSLVKLKVNFMNLCYNVSAACSYR